MVGQTDCQNQGYGTEAVRLAMRFGFEELNLNRIELCVFDHNPRGIRVYEKCGFVAEGRMRQASFRHGQYRDVLRYAILRSEWSATRKSADVASAAVV
jgi:RimJ/RimL family protein N-acetyltransferase